jgi:hypothetical protein
MAIGVIIATILSGIWAGVKAISDKAITIAVTIFNAMKSAFGWFLMTAPKWVKFLFFFFIIIVLADGILGFFVGLNYACTSDEQLRTSYGIVGGAGLYFSRVFQNFENSTTDYDQFILDNTVVAKQYDKTDPRGIFYVKCFSDKPKFTFAGLNFLNPQYWAIILLIGALIMIGTKFGSFQ